VDPSEVGVLRTSRVLAPNRGNENSGRFDRSTSASSAVSIDLDPSIPKLAVRRRGTTRMNSILAPIRFGRRTAIPGVAYMGTWSANRFQALSQGIAVPPYTVE